MMDIIDAEFLEENAPCGHWTYRATIDAKSEGGVQLLEIVEPGIVVHAKPEPAYLRKNLLGFKSFQGTIELTITIPVPPSKEMPNAIQVAVTLKQRTPSPQVSVVVKKLTIRIPRLVVKSFWNRAKMIIPVFREIYGSLTKWNDRGPTPAADEKKMIERFPLFYYEIQNVAPNHVVGTTARIEVNVGGRRIAEGHARLGDLAPAETQERQMWVAFLPDILEGCPTGTAEATLAVQAGNSASATASIQGIQIAGIDDMAWISSVINGNLAAPGSNLGLKDLDLLDYAAIWIATTDDRLITSKLTRYRGERDSFLAFVRGIKGNVGVVPDPDRIVEAIFRELREVDFKPSQQVYLFPALQNLQKVFPPEILLEIKEGNCINLSILFCTVAELCGMADELATGLCFVEKGGGVLHAMPCLCNRYGRRSIYDVANPVFWQGPIGNRITADMEAEAAEVMKGANGRTRCIMTWEVHKRFI